MREKSKSQRRETASRQVPGLPFRLEVMPLRDHDGRESNGSQYHGMGSLLEENFAHGIG